MGGIHGLLNEAREYKRSAFADATKKVYQSHLNSYLIFCREFKRNPVPASQDTIIGYIVHLARRLKPSSIPGYINIIRLLYVDAGLKNPLADNWEVKLLKKGICRLKGSPPKQKLPVTLCILEKIYGVLNLKSPRDLAFWATTLVGFFGFFRKSTLLPSKGGNLVVGKFIARSDVTKFTLESFNIVVRHSKVIQFGQRVQNVPFVRVAKGLLCPVKAMLTHLGASPLLRESPVFNYVMDGSEVALTQEAYVIMLRKALELSGENPLEYSAHSLRRGGASYAFQVGLSHIQIKERGDWSSSCFEKYIHVGVDSLLKTAHVLAGGVRWC
jgi:hypothetical protein